MNPPTPPTPPPVPPVTYAPVPPAPPASGGAKKWVLFGCGGCLGLLVLGGVVVAAIFYFVFGAMKKSDVYVEAVKRAQNSAEVQAVLGTPIEPGWMISGSFNYENGSGSANFTIPLKGPKGEASVLAVGQKAGGGDWIYSQLEAVLPNGTKVDLNNSSSTSGSSEPAPAAEPAEETPVQ